jgi:hypothetical protein
VNRELETYLRRATRGLWGKKRLEVREELTQHVLEKAHGHRVVGFSQDAAISKVLSELGDPRAVRDGMIGVHTMPNLLKSSFAAALVATIAAISLNGTSAQVTAISRTPVEPCLTTNATTYQSVGDKGQLMTGGCIGGYWLELTSLRAVLEPLGVRFEKLSVNTFETWAVTFPEGGSALFSPFSNDYGRMGDEQIRPGYIFATSLVERLRTSGLRVTLAGWDNPAIRVGKTRFTVGTETKTVFGRDWYPNVLGERVQAFFAGVIPDVLIGDAAGRLESWSWLQPTPYRQHTHRIQTELKAGSIVFVLSREISTKAVVDGKTETFPAFARAFYAPVRADGSFEYPSAAKTLQFSGDPRSLKSTTPESVGNIVVYRFNNDISYQAKSFDLVPLEKLSK